MPAYQCPKCGDPNSLRVELSCFVTMLPDGEIEYDDNEYPTIQNRHYCYCTACEEDGTVEDFLVKEEERNPCR